MTSWSWSCIDCLIPTYSSLVLLLHTFWTKNLDYLPSCSKILFIKTSTVFLNLCDFWNIMVSQGSSATYLRFVEICNDYFVANLVLSLAVKELWKSINISWSYQRESGVLFFWLSVFQVSWKLVEGSWRCGGRKSPSPIDLAHGFITACTTILSFWNSKIIYVNFCPLAY